jgi:hypothetical protein
VAALHSILTGLLRPWSEALQNRAASTRRQADKRREDKRQVCAPLAELVQLSGERLLVTSDEWRRVTVSGENIALLDQYRGDLIAWCASNGLPVADNTAALLVHVRRYCSLLHTIVNGLRELPVAEHKGDCVSRLNLVQMKLELELQAINRYIA